MTIIYPTLKLSYYKLRRGVGKYNTATCLLTFPAPNRLAYHFFSLFDVTELLDYS